MTSTSCWCRWAREKRLTCTCSQLTPSSIQSVLHLTTAISIIIFHFKLFDHQEFYSMVPEPLDLSKIQLNIHGGHYSELHEVCSHVTQMFHNLMRLYRDPDSRVSRQAGACIGEIFVRFKGNRLIFQSSLQRQLFSTDFTYNCRSMLVL